MLFVKVNIDYNELSNIKQISNIVWKAIEKKT